MSSNDILMISGGFTDDAKGSRCLQLLLILASLKRLHQASHGSIHLS
jgi:hypothetical protein